MSCRLTSSPVWAITRTSSVSAPQMSPSPSRTLSGRSAPSRSPWASTSRTSFRASLPGESGWKVSGCHCTKVKLKNSGFLVALPASASQKSLKARRKPPSGDARPISKPPRAKSSTSRAVHSRTVRAKAGLLPKRR